MSPRSGERERAIGVGLWRSLFAAAAVSVLAVGAAGAQAAGGALDPSFGHGGKVLTGFGARSAVVRAYGLAIQADGKIVAVGSAWRTDFTHDFALVHYTPSGKPDTAFGAGGKALTSLGGGRDDVARAVVLQADGKIIAAGDSSGDFALVRYTTRGKLDPSFGKGGKVLTDLDPGTADDRVSAVAVQPDGKVVVAGYSEARHLWGDFALVRYTTSGKLDASFGSGGKVFTNFGAKCDDRAHAVAVQADGKIVAAGSRCEGVDDPISHLALVRYTTSGKLDASFGKGGKVLTDLGSDTEWFSAVALQADGDIVAAGGSGGDFALVRYTSGGVIDPSFGSSGHVLTDIGSSSTDWASAVAVQKDGKIVAVGHYDSRAGGYDYDFALVRYTTTGALDASFGKDSRVLTDVGTNSTDWPFAVAIQKDGKIIAAGYTALPRAESITLVRYTK